MASNEDFAVSFYEEPQWNSQPAWKLPGWGEPVVSYAANDIISIGN